MDVSVRPTHGEMREVYRCETSAGFEWTIPDCSKLLPGHHFSPTVNCFNRNWFFDLLTDQSRPYVVYLHREPSLTKILQPFRFTLGYRTAEYGGGDTARDQAFPMDDRPWSILWESQKPSGKLTLTWILRKEDWYHAEGVSRGTGIEGASCSNGRRDEHGNPGSKGVSRETQTEDTGFKDISTLSEEFKKLLLSGDGHDVLIKVGDKQFRAHECVLRARSPVFAAMFRNDMAESANGLVTIEDCDPDSFGQFLQFLYSGQVDVASPGTALGLYHAGDKYDIPRLKEICVGFLKISFTARTVFDVIQLAATHDEEELLQQAIAYFADNLEEVLLTVEWQRFMAANPVQANEMYLKAAQCLKTSS